MADQVDEDCQRRELWQQSVAESQSSGTCSGAEGNAEDLTSEGDGGCEDEDRTEPSLFRALGFWLLLHCLFPGHRYLGPTRCCGGDEPVDEDDRIAQEHDQDYRCATTPSDVRKADRAAIEKFWRDVTINRNWHSFIGLLIVGVKFVLESILPRLIYPPGLDQRREEECAAGVIFVNENRDLQASPSQTQRCPCQEQQVEQTPPEHRRGRSPTPFPRAPLAQSSPARCPRGTNSPGVIPIAPSPVTSNTILHALQRVRDKAEQIRELAKCSKLEKTNNLKTKLDQVTCRIQGLECQATPQGRVNVTFDVECQNATLDGGRNNATFDVGRQNKTFDVDPLNAMFDVVRQNTTYDVDCQNAMFEAKRQNKTYDVDPLNATFDVGRQNTTYDVDCQNAMFEAKRQDKTYDVDCHNVMYHAGRHNATYDVDCENATFNANTTFEFGRNDKTYVWQREDSNIKRVFNDISLEDDFVEPLITDELNEMVTLRKADRGCSNVAQNTTFNSNLSENEPFEVDNPPDEAVKMYWPQDTTSSSSLLVVSDEDLRRRIEASQERVRAIIERMRNIVDREYDNQDLNRTY